MQMKRILLVYIPAVSILLLIVRRSADVYRLYAGNLPGVQSVSAGVEKCGTVGGGKRGEEYCV